MPSVMAVGGAVVSLFTLLAHDSIGATVDSRAEQAAAPAAVVAAADVDASAALVIEAATINGSGCPAGTANVTVLSDGASIRITYGGYRAEVGAGAEATDIRKNCQINVEVQVPQGFTYTVARAEHFGSARLAAGATGLQATSYYFQGDSDTTQVTHKFTGPFDDNWQTTDVIDLGSLGYAPCDVKRNLNLNTELRVDAGTSNSTNSFMAGSRSDFHFVGKAC